MARSNLFALVAVLALCFGACSASKWEADLDAANQVPPLTEADVMGATGTFSMWEMGTMYMWELSVKDVTNLTMAHIHWGNSTINGPVAVILLPLNGVTHNGTLPMLKTPFSGSKTWNGTFTLADLQPVVTADEFNSWLEYDTEEYLYVNIHTTVYPAGAIRGQLYWSSMPSMSPEMAPAPAPTPMMSAATSVGALGKAAALLLAAVLAAFL